MCEISKYGTHCILCGADSTASIDAHTRIENKWNGVVSKNYYLTPTVTKVGNWILYQTNKMWSELRKEQDE
jgi:hypothetical protein